MIKVLQTVEAYRAWREQLGADETLGFVPTMGGLHEGHFSLVRRSLAENNAFSCDDAPGVSPAFSARAPVRSGIGRIRW